MRIIWQTVKRITDEILGFKGLRELAMKGSMSCGGDVMGRENSEENHALFIYFPYSTLPLDAPYFMRFFMTVRGKTAILKLFQVFGKSL